MNQDTQEKYNKHFTEDNFWKKVLNVAKSAGIKVIYAALLLYYLIIDAKTPKKSKLIIAGALGYFILPLDLVFDAIPVLGYIDDLSVLLFAIGEVAGQITNEIQERAKNQLTKWFGIINEADISVIDEKIGNAPKPDNTL